MAETLWHHVTADETLQGLSTSLEGLSGAEAAERLTHYGPNALQEAKGISPWQILLAQFKNFLILLLLAATVISLVLGHTLDAIIIFSIVILSALLGFYQEFRAERAMEALKAMASPTASVVRGGEQMCPATSSCWPPGTAYRRTGDWWRRSTSRLTRHP
jgi:Ca2+-transporting ATPase